MRQRLGPKVGGRVQGVAVASGHGHLGPKFFPNEVFHLEGAVVGLENIFDFFTFPEALRKQFNLTTVITIYNLQLVKHFRAISFGSVDSPK